MKKKIVTDLNLLRQKSEPVEIEETESILQDLEDSIDSKAGIGLSAVQIGLHKAVGIIRKGDIKIDLINPTIVDKDRPFRFNGEGCLSLPGLYVDTRRYADITLENNGKLYTFDLETDGIICVAIQHEIDHMNGLLMLNRKWRKRR